MAFPFPRAELHSEICVYFGGRTSGVPPRAYRYRAGSLFQQNPRGCGGSPVPVKRLAIMVLCDLWFCAIGHRLLRVVSCRSRSHRRPLSERLGRGVSVVGQQRITSALFFETRALGQMLGHRSEVEEISIHHQSLSLCSGRRKIQPKPLTPCWTRAISLIDYSVSLPPLEAVTSTSIGAARTRASTLGHQQISAAPQLLRSGQCVFAATVMVLLPGYWSHIPL
jgi:hypothetical protein